MVEAAELLGIVVDDFLIVGLQEKEEDLVDHQKREGLSKKIDIDYKCDQCNFTTEDKYQLSSHKKAKHSGILYDCDECDHQSAYKKNLYRHKRMKHPSFPNNWDEEGKEKLNGILAEEELRVNDGMENSEESFTKEKLINGQAEEGSHLIRILESPEQKIVKIEPYDSPKERYKDEANSNSLHPQRARYKCTQCDLKTLSKSHLKRHMIWKHSGIRYDCGECNYQTAYKKSLKRHKWGAHQIIAESALTCAQCDNKYPFDSQDLLSQHIKKHHV